MVIGDAATTLQTALKATSLDSKKAEAISAGVISKVDKLYEEGGPGEIGFDPVKITQQAFGTSVAVKAGYRGHGSGRGPGWDEHSKTATIANITVQHSTGASTKNSELDTIKVDGHVISADKDNIITIDGKKLQGDPEKVKKLAGQIHQAVANVIAQDKDGVARFSLQEAHDISLIANLVNQAAKSNGPAK